MSWPGPCISLRHRGKRIHYCVYVCEKIFHKRGENPGLICHAASAAGAWLRCFTKRCYLWQLHYTYQMCAWHCLPCNNSAEKYENSCTPAKAAISHFAITEVKCDSISGKQYCENCPKREMQCNFLKKKWIYILKGQKCHLWDFVTIFTFATFPW